MSLRVDINAAPVTRQAIDYVVEAERLGAGVVPPLLWAAPVLFVQELWFRGWMQKRAGWLATALAWAAVIAPLHPIAGVVGGLCLGWAGRSGMPTALLARAIAWSIAFGALSLG